MGKGDGALIYLKLLPSLSDSRNFRPLQLHKTRKNVSHNQLTS